MNSQPFQRYQRTINRNSRPTHLSVVKQPTEERRQELTWECVKGAPGFYQPRPFNQEPKPGEGLKFTYEGCGVMEPRDVMGYLHRRNCSCESKARKLYEKRQQERDWIREHQRTTYGWLGDRWSDLELASKSFENYNESLQPNAYETVKEYVDVLSGTLILHGSYGTGKTHLLAALCNELLKRQTSCLFVTAPKLFQAILGHISRNEPWEQIINRAIQAPFLVIDDIDKAKWSEHREEVYFAIIDERAKAGKPIAISTNKLDELEKFVGGACASRLSIGRIEQKMIGLDVREAL